MENTHIKRWITGIIAIPIIIYIVAFGPRWTFNLVLFLTAFTGLMEYHGIISPRLPRQISWPQYLLSLILFVILHTGNFYLAPAFIALMAFVPMAVLVLISNVPGPHSVGDIGKALLGPIYVCLPLALLIIINRHPQGNTWILFLLAVIFAGDTGAFYCGKFLGKHKLHEMISPGKTWEGAVGGAAGAFIVALWFLFLTRLHPIDLGAFFLVLFLIIAAQMGDLAESLLKRSFTKKDSGKILPGHGGILDRIDGLLFAIPILYIYLYL